MLTRIQIKNFKRFEAVNIELGASVVFIGPNNSGKTTALQALSLWQMGVTRWLDVRSKSSGKERTGITLNRRDFTAIPVPGAKELWRNLHVRESYFDSDKRKTRNIRIEINVTGISKGHPWNFALEFDYANQESIYCRPSSQSPEMTDELRECLNETKTAFLPPMSGLAAVEPKLEAGRVNVLIGEGQTAQVLRNLCWQIYDKNDGSWQKISNHMERFFRMSIQPPIHLKGRGEFAMRYKENKNDFDLSSAGRGMQQVLLLLAYLYGNPGAVLLLDEPDAHLEVLRQREIFNTISTTAEELESQLIVASHSEVVLNEAIDRSTVVAFLGSAPRRVDEAYKSEISKALCRIKFEDYYQAAIKGWVLYLEGSTDLAMLKALAKKLRHKAVDVLDNVFVYYLNCNIPIQARDHFFGLHTAEPALLGVAVFDRLDTHPQSQHPNLIEVMWRKKEIENYIFSKETLQAYARTFEDALPLFQAQLDRVKAMDECIRETEQYLAQREEDLWSDDRLASKEFDGLMRAFQKKTGIQTVRKKDFSTLAAYMPAKKIDQEVTEKLDVIWQVAEKAYKH